MHEEIRVHQHLRLLKEYRIHGRKAKEGLFLIANFFPGKRSVAPSAQNPKFEFGTFGAVLNFLGMIEVVHHPIIPQQFKTALKVAKS